MNHIDLKNKTVFVTGSAGFIGSNLVLDFYEHNLQSTSSDWTT